MKTTVLGKALLEARGMRPLRAVADKIGVSVATLSRLENGGKPDLDTFESVMRWLEIQPKDWAKFMNLRQQ